MKAKSFGKIDTGATVELYELNNGKLHAEIITFGAILKELSLLGKNPRNIVGSYDCIEDYLADTSHQGAIIGRVANRIENSILTIDGKDYTLTENDNGNCLHGGDGFDRKIWKVESYTDTEIKLSYFSSDGEEGFPGRLEVYVTYSLSDTALIIDYEAIPYAKTAISLTNHSYFNLNGFGDTIYNHKITVPAEKYSEVNDKLIPTGNHPSVSGTIFDLRTPAIMGERLSEIFFGYDHNYIINGDTYAEIGGKRLLLCGRAEVEDLSLSVYSDLTEMQLYTANFLSGEPNFSGGAKRIKHGAFCFETQIEPNSVNRGRGIYDKGDIYRHTTAFVLSEK